MSSEFSVHAQKINNENITFSLQFVAISRLSDLQKPANLSSELESLMYCFLYAATQDQLHWKHSTSIAEAFNAKGVAMRVPDVFQDKVLCRVEPELKGIAASLQELCFPLPKQPLGTPEQAVSVSEFQACLLNFS